MSELVIELFCEEIPAIMQSKAEIAYLDIFAKYFQEKEIVFKNIEIFIGPRRIVVYAKGLDTEIKGKSISIKGPKADSPVSAIEGFCKSNNISQADLVVREIKGAKCYFYEKEIITQKVVSILLSSLLEPIMEYVWPKSMYWSDYKIKWVRPLKNILCVFDGEIIPFKLGHLTANNVTFGHRFMSPQQIVVKDFAGYKKDLAENFVVLNRSDRLNTIRVSLETEAKSLNLIIKDDPALLEEVAGLVEYPVILRGAIEQKFLKLPSEVLVSSMRTHQKYFSLFNEEGKFAPYFLFVSNIASSNPNMVIKGNEKVLSARLSDALYFYHQDLKKPLENGVDNLDKVIFHAKLGSLKAKVKRLVSLTKFIDVKSSLAAEAASICKSDILSEVVGEFPNLQGIMGYYYALSGGKQEAIAVAIRDHYKPQGPGDSVPTGAAAVLALADKIDSLCGLMLAGEKPTGSKDPYAVRRLALGIIRIILENKLQQNIVKLVEFSCSLYAPFIHYNSAETHQIISFIEERAKNYFKEQFDNAQVSAVVNSWLEPDLLVTKWKLEALNSFLGTVSGGVLLNSYKRASNIIGSAKLNGEINPDLFDQQEEIQLMEFLTLNLAYIDLLIEKKDFLESLKTLSSMNHVIANFFENVMVMDKNPEIANNRLLLLDKIRHLFNKVANFDLL